MSDLVVRAVIVGSLVDLVGTTIVALAFQAAVAASAGATTAEQLSTVIEGSTTLLLVQLALGLAMTLVGAYVAAHLVRGKERLHAFAVGIVSTAVGFLFVFSAPEAVPFWAEAAGLILTIPAAFAGGEIRRAIVARGGRPA